MGDYADLITPSDFKRWDGRILADWMKGNEDNIGATQCKQVNKLLKPIWDKCCGLLEGNHDESIRRYNHYNFISELLEKANNTDDKNEWKIKPAGISCFLVFKFHRKNSNEMHNIIIHARHGEGSARTSGARALAVLRLAQTFTNAHITVSGHLHGQESPDVPQRLIYHDGKIKAFEAIATMTGAWIKAYAQGVPPCYLERWGTPPSKLGAPRIVFETTKEGINYTLEKTGKTGLFE